MNIRQVYSGTSGRWYAMVDRGQEWVEVSFDHYPTLDEILSAAQVAFDAMDANAQVSA